MPELLEPKRLEEVNLEDIPYKLFGVDVEDATALKLVTETFNRYANSRDQNHTERWKQNDNLYHGWVPKKNWPGTRVPRSSLGIPISFDQVETVFPIISGALFGHEPYWFDVKATQFSSPQTARQVQGTLAYFVDTPNDASGIGIVEHLKLGLHDYLQHGNCVIEVGWDPSRNTLFGDWVNLRDFYISPTLDTPLVDRSPAVIRRKRMSVEEIELLRGVDGFKVPPAGVLNLFSKSRLDDTADLSKDWQGYLHGEQSLAGFVEADPSHQSAELLQYWTDHRMVWVINRRWVIYNGRNPYGFKPFVFGTLYPVLGKAYGMSLPDILEGEQMYIQGLVNFRLDEINMALNQPRSRQRESVEFPGQLSIHPGFIDFVEQPDKTQFHAPMNITREAYTEVQLAEQRAQKRSGVSQLMSAGIPQASNANRTAGGVQAQSAASNSRIRPIIENFENFVIVPFLYKAQMILNKFIPATIPQVPSMTEEGGTELVPREVLGQPVRYRMTAASRTSLQAQLAPFAQFITQTIMNEGVMKALAGQGKTVDTDEWQQFIQDATNTSQKYAFFRPMTPEEQQAQGQPSPEAQMEMQKAQLEAQTRIQMGQMKAQTEQSKVQADVETKSRETSEKSNRELIKHLSQQQIEALKAKAKEKEKSGKSSTKS